MSTAKAIRTSKRDRKPVDRLGNPVPTTTRRCILPTQKANYEMSSSSRIQVAPSIHSQCSSASTKKNQLVVQRRAMEICAEMDERFAEKKRITLKEIAHLELELATANEELVSLQLSRNQATSAEERTDIDNQVAVTLSKISSIKAEHKSKEIDLKCDAEENEAKKKNIVDIAEEDKKMIEVESEIEDDYKSLKSLSLDGGDSGKAQRTSDWVDINDEDGEEESENEEVNLLTKELLRVSVDKPVTSPVHVPVKKACKSTIVTKSKAKTEEPKQLQVIPPQSISQPQPPPSSSSNEDALQMIAQAFQAMSTFPSASQPNNTSERFLARQIQGKDLPIFTGRPEEWPSFIAAFDNSTRTCVYSDADNLSRLQKCLRGDALKTVQGLLIDPSSVPACIKQLKMRYGSPEHIIESMMNKARETPPIRSDKPETFIEFGLAINNFRAMIKALSCPQHLSNPILLKELVHKMPFSFQLQWMTYVKSDATRIQSIDTFADWIEIQTELACSLCPPSQKTEAPRNQRRVLAVSESETKTYSKSNYRSGEKRLVTCPSCKKDHKLQTCREFSKEDITSRWKFAREKKLCFCCLNGGHASGDCRSKRKCGVDGCDRQHHPLLHQPRNSKSTPQEEENQSRPEKESSSNQLSVPDVKGTINSVVPSGYVSLKVLPVKLRGNNGKMVNVLAFLDDGSSLTIIDEEVAEELGLHGVEQRLNVTCFQAEVSLDSQNVDLVVESLDGKVVQTLTNVRTARSISLPEQSVRRDLLKRYDHLRDLNIQSYDYECPKILIGMDHADLVLSRELRLGKGNAPIAARTLLGWTLCGNVPFRSREMYGYHIQEIIEDPLHQLVKHQFTTEAFGVMPHVQAPRSKADQRAQQILDSTLTRVEHGWECGLLWKEDIVQMPDSYNNAKKRLMTMERKMDRDEEFGKQYCQRIAEYQQKGFARLLSKEESKLHTQKTYYLPHFMAANPKKQNKLRFVFDAAAKCYGTSLNDKLLQGPDKMVSLPGVLLKFRQRQVGFTADIKDMFHRVRVKKEDAQAQRFLWRGMDRDREPDVMEMSVLIFGAACSPSCAQEAKNKNAEEFKQDYPAAYKAIVHRHYVDDYLDCSDTVEQAVEMFKSVREVQSKGGFDLCNWLSSSQEMMKTIPLELHAKSVKNVEAEKDVLLERVLGLFWKPIPDKFTFSLSFVKSTGDLMSGERIPTKRELLSLTMSIFDPLGFIAVLTIKARSILQSTWRSKVDWNDDIPPDTYQAWTDWIKEVKLLPNFQIPRCYSSNFSSADDIQLHIFGDASQQAFGAVGYFRIQKGEEVETAFVMAKSRVAPMKTLSIPRMELQAAVMGCRLAQFLISEIEIPVNRTVLWSDSQTVLGWVRSDGNKFLQFVAHRIGEIQELSNSNQWRWVPTALNVADELTRMEKPCDWSPGSRWLNGPEFLKLSEDQWPQPKETPPKLIEGPEFEMRSNFNFKIQEADKLINPAEYSSWRRLVGVTSYVLRFVKNLTERIKQIPVPMGVSRTADLLEAEQWWWRWSQVASYPDEITSLKNKKQLDKSSSLIKLSPYLDEDGVMRVRGRIDQATSVPINVKRPVILHPKNPYTKLLVRHYHENCGHHGHERIVNEMRQQFYIPHLRSAVKRAKVECQKCKNEAAKPIIPEMGQLPKYRLESHVFPFNTTGVDYFGPIEVTVKRSREKRYGVLFTCLSTRAIHLEIANSLSTDSCILAIRRFVGRRGCPKHLYSDNGTNFHGACNEMKTSLAEINQTQLEEECSSKGIEWHFIPPAAPHMGGSWERMVRATKVALGATLEVKNLSDEVLATLMVEAEHVVNSHPLTYVPEDPEDPEALTPNHFLLGRSSNHQPMGEFDHKEIFGRKQWRVTQQLADHFWRRWIQEYLPTLMRREKWCRMTRPIQVGDVVLEINANLRRNSWPKGRVVRVFPGADGLTRVVEVKMAGGQVYRRPVSKLCILDVISKEESKKVEPPCHEEFPLPSNCNEP